MEQNFADLSLCAIGSYIVTGKTSLGRDGRIAKARNDEKMKPVAKTGSFVALFALCGSSRFRDSGLGDDPKFRH